MGLDMLMGVYILIGLSMLMGLDMPFGFVGVIHLNYVSYILITLIWLSANMAADIIMDIYFIKLVFTWNLPGIM